MFIFLSFYHTPADKDNRGELFLINLEKLYFLLNKGQKVIWGTENNDPECRRMGVER